MTWNACGGLSGDGSASWLAQSGESWCENGSRACVVRDVYSDSSIAASDLRSRVAGIATRGVTLDALEVTTVGEAYVLHLKEPVTPNPAVHTEFGWIVVWTRENTLWTAYACSRTGVLNLFKSRVSKDL